LTIRGQ